MTWLVFVLLALAVYRVTRAIVRDQVGAPVRRALARRFPPRVGPLVDEATGTEIEGTATVRPRWPVVLASCAWCLGTWLSLAGVLAVHLAGLLDSWFLVVLAWLAVSSVVGLIHEWAEAS